MKIKLTIGSNRHFRQGFGGTKILDYTKENFEKKVNEIIGQNIKYLSESKEKIIDGYDPICKIAIIKNFTSARVGVTSITLENYQYLRSGYSARYKNELEVFSRWLELPIKPKKAEYLALILYSKEQINKESKFHSKQFNETFIEFTADWGIVAILAQDSYEEEPMKPETIIRNSLGIKEGGSGVEIDREYYAKSVKFWQTHATIK